MSSPYQRMSHCLAQRCRCNQPQASVLGSVLCTPEGLHRAQRLAEAKTTLFVCRGSFLVWDRCRVWVCSTCMAWASSWPSWRRRMAFRSSLGQATLRLSPPGLVSEQVGLLTHPLVSNLQQCCMPSGVLVSLQCITCKIHCRPPIWMSISAHVHDMSASILAAS